MDDQLVTATLIFAYHPEIDNRVLLIREVDGFATHWMQADGNWVGLDGDMESLFESLINVPELLPLIYDPTDDEDQDVTL